MVIEGRGDEELGQISNVDGSADLSQIEEPRPEVY
jgi:hypothetical protein